MGLFRIGAPPPPHQGPSHIPGPSLTTLHSLGPYAWRPNPPNSRARFFTATSSKYSPNPESQDLKPSLLTLPGPSSWQRHYHHSRGLLENLTPHTPSRPGGLLSCHSLPVPWALGLVRIASSSFSPGLWTPPPHTTSLSGPRPPSSPVRPGPIPHSPHPALYHSHYQCSSGPPEFV